MYKLVQMKHHLQPNVVKNIPRDIADAVHQVATEISPMVYVGGFIAKKLLQCIDCKNCGNQILLSSSFPCITYVQRVANV